MLPGQGGFDLFLEVLDGRLLAQVHMEIHEASSHGRYGPAIRWRCNTHSYGRALKLACLDVWLATRLWPWSFSEDKTVGLLACDARQGII
jgi:hypothetical protein